MQTMKTSNLNETAWKAVQRFNKQKHIFEGFARALTGKNIKVQVGKNMGSSTDGSTIYLQPPFEFGLDYEHDRAVCSQRNQYGKALCEACGVRETMLVYMFHEIAHIVFESIKLYSDFKSTKFFDEYVNLTQDTGINYLSYDQTVYHILNRYSKFGAFMLNVMEDIRIDNAMYKERPGYQEMSLSNYRESISEGSSDLDGNKTSWAEQDVNSQAFMAPLIIAFEIKEYCTEFAPEVKALFEDEELCKIVDRAATAGSVFENMINTVELLNRMKELGFLLEQKDRDEREEQQEGNTEDSPGEPEGGEGNSEGGTQSEGDHSGGQHDDLEGDRQDCADGSGSGNLQREFESELEDQDGEASNRPDGTGEQSDEVGDGGGGSSEGRDGGEGVEAGSESEPEDGEGSSSSGETGGSGGSGGGGGDVLSQREGTETSTTTATISDNGGPERNGEKSGHRGDRADAEQDSTRGNRVSNRLDSSDDPTAAQGSSEKYRDLGMDGSILGGKDQEELQLPECNGDSGSDQGNGLGNSSQGGLDGPDEPADDGASNAPDTDSGTDTQPTDADPVEGELDAPTGTADHGEPLPDHGDADEKLIQDMLDSLLGHHMFLGKDHQHIGMTERQKEALRIAAEQAKNFDAPSSAILGVAEVETEDDDWVSAIRRDGNWISYYPYYDEGIDVSEITPGEGILSSALLKMRITFEDNMRAKEVRHLKSGKINTRVLGKRAPQGDTRLFKKRSRPGKKDYAVVISLDCSGSIGSGSETFKEEMKAAYAQAELLNRLGIKFAMYGHTGCNSSKDSMTKGPNRILMCKIKDYDEPWSKKAHKKLAGLKSLSANADGHTLEFLRKSIMTQQVEKRIIMYYSDGAMPYFNFHEELRILKRELDICKKLGITVAGVGIGTDSPSDHGLPTVRVDSESDIVNVVSHIEQLINL